MVSGSCMLFQLTLKISTRFKATNDPITAEEILQDGGDYVVAPDGRFIEYFTCGTNLPGAEWVYMQHGYGSTGKFIHSFKTICKEAAENNLKLFSPSLPGFGLSSNYPVGVVRKSMISNDTESQSEYSISQYY